MAKSTTPQQHIMLHQHWPNDCCLCNHEAVIIALRKERALLRVALRNLMPKGHTRGCRGLSKKRCSFRCLDAQIALREPPWI